MAKFSSSGALDPTFTAPLATNTAHPTRPAVITNARFEPNGRIWVLGRFDTFGGKPAPGVARLNPDGTLDNSFSLSDVAYYDSFGDYADVVFADNNVAYLVGTFRQPGETIPFAVTRIVAPSVITSPLTATATVGQPFTYQIVGTNSPTSFTASPLPAGLSLQGSLGVITGTPSQAGNTNVTVTASTSGGGDSKTLVITVEPAPPAGGPHVTSGAVTGRTGNAFSYQVIVTGASSAATFSATGLPAGLSINSQTGIISGTPSQDGSFTATVTVTDGSASASGTIQLTLSSDPYFPIITSAPSANVVPGSAFNYAVTAPGSTDLSDPTTYSISGSLPPGLVFNPATGTISGTYNPQSTSSASGRPGLKELTTASGPVVLTIQIFAHNSHGTATTTLTFIGVPGLVGNVSTRLPVGTDENVLIEACFIVLQGPAGSTKKIMVRAIGPHRSWDFGCPGESNLGNPRCDQCDCRDE